MKGKINVRVVLIPDPLLLVELLMLLVSFVLAWKAMQISWAHVAEGLILGLLGGG